MSKEPDDVIDCMARIKGEEQPFAVATVVHVHGGASAKPGAKAIVRGDGSVIGWVGGGCTFGAVRKASSQALVDGRTRLIRVRPGDGEEDAIEIHHADHVEDFDSFCPTAGIVEILIEPVLPRPSLLIVGASLVASALCDLGKRLGFAVSVAALTDDVGLFSDPDQVIEGFDPRQTLRPESSFVVVASQGKRDRDALRFALATGSPYVAFVASRRKAAKLKQDLIDGGSDAVLVERIRAPAGAHIGAVTPEEIALSILTDIVRERRIGGPADIDMDDLATSGNAPVVPRDGYLGDDAESDATANAERSR